MRRFDIAGIGHREISLGESVVVHDPFVLGGLETEAYFVSQAEGASKIAAPRGLLPERPAAPSPIGGSAKRILDVFVAVAAIILAAPVLVIIAIAVKLNMGGDVVYRHRRVGFGGRTFDCLKFRTMVANSDEVLARHLLENAEAAEEWRRHRKLSKDPRITHLGKFLRKTSIDELPQLFNILRGDMSCVGPRPVVSDELTYYGSAVGDYLAARPGITGPWQVSGRSSVGYDRRIELDSAYVRHWSLVRDIEILARTVPAVLRVNQAA